PMAVFTLYASMSRIDRNLVPAAGILGANPVQAFVRVYLPLSVPAVVASSVLVFILAIGFYITPVLLGGAGDMMISQLIVIQMTTLLDFELGYASSVLLLLATLVVLALAGRVIPLEQIWTPGDVQRARAGAKAAGTVKRAAVRAAAPVAVAAEKLLFLLARP